MADRPLGVTIIGILWILYGLVLIFLGIIGGVLLSFAGLGAIGTLIGIVLFVLGIIYLVLGIGSFMAWPWVWIVGVIFTVIGLLLNLVTLVSGGISAIFGIIIDAIILWYLFQPQVKTYFKTT